jgi:hypothetical protein
MKSNPGTKNIILLPVYFKRIGAVIAVVGFFAAVIMHTTLNQYENELSRVFTFGTCMLGLLFVAFSKEKIEDESTVHRRLKAFASTFTFVVIYIILISPIGDLIFEDKVTDLTNREIVFMMLFFYLAMYYSQKTPR